MSKKKKIIIIIAVIVVLAAIGFGIIYFVKGGVPGAASAENAVYVDSVANITGLGSGNGQNDRFSGVVEPQETWKIEVTQDKKVSEIYVEVSQEVKKGDKLFTYDTVEMQDNLNQAELELESKQNDIDSTNQQIAELQEEKKNASQDEQLNYTTQIQTAQNTVKRTEYEKKAKAVEIENLKKQITNADVLCEIDGVIKSINKDGTATTSTGEQEPFMTVLATGDYRVKGKVNEQNMSQILEGSPVIVRSRVDSDITWKGTLTAVDTDKAEASQSSMFSSSGSDTTSSNYPFYVILDTKEGLMLGQHVYIEMDNGQDEVKEGLWLDSYYIVMDEEKPEEAYVWTENGKERLEKRTVTLGEFDEELQKYQITDGLTAEDYIAYPDESLSEGTPTTKNIDQIGGMGNDSSMDDEFDEGDIDNMVPGSGPGDVSGGDMNGGITTYDMNGEADLSGEVISGDDSGDDADDGSFDNPNGTMAVPEAAGEIGDGSAPASALGN